MEKEIKEAKRHIGILDLERRKYPRFKINLPLDYYRVETPAGQTGRAENASEGGLEIYFPEEMQIGERLKLKLFFSSSETELNTIEALAEVVWIDILSGDGEFRSGVKFVDISPEDLVRLKDFLDSLTR
jgi:c-di-GMP-binding flagellar brake protein YcgR